MRMLSDDELLELAGKAAFARGRSYCAEGRIALSEREDDGFAGEAEGSETYALWMQRDDDGWDWDCACPAADGGAFCKHLVAAVLTARAESQSDEDEDAKPPLRATKRSGDLGGFLRAQSSERLAAWLLALADEDSTIAKRLHLYRAADDPVELKSALGKMLDPGGFLDYRRSNAYARRLGTVVAQLEDAITRDASAGRGLCEYTIGRLLKIYGRSDDSGGSIGEQLHAIAALHARACAASPPGKALAKSLLALQHKDDWGLFPLHAYWNALGVDGQADYGRRIAADFATLPASPSDEARWGEAFGIERRAEDFARASGEFEFLQRVLRRHLSRPPDYLRVLESLNEFGRAREALAWAELSVKQFPKDQGLRTALAECLSSAGLEDDAIEQSWQAFYLRPDTGNWDRLKRMAAAQWSSWRERALAEIAARERDESSHRVVLLEHDGDLDAAVALARECKIQPDVLATLAHRIERDTPLVAGAFHLRIARLQLQHVDPSRYVALVRTLQHVARCLPEADWKPVVAHVRAEHARKTKLIKLLDAARL